MPQGRDPGEYVDKKRRTRRQSISSGKRAYKDPAKVAEILKKSHEGASNSALMLEYPLIVKDASYISRWRKKAKNDKLRAAAVVKLLERKQEPEVDLSDTQMLQALNNMEADLAAKAGWSCQNPECNVVFQQKAKYIRSTWPPLSRRYQKDMIFVNVWFLHWVYSSKSGKIAIWRDHALRCGKRDISGDRDRAEVKRRKLLAAEKKKRLKKVREQYK